MLGAAALIEAADLKPNWFQAAVLASAFLQITDVPGADTEPGLALRLRGRERGRVKP
ncbi:MAG: hypothetical protein JO372_17115 [Solirubrobacterales bacterium]|nr:hypothetical protein [Solirubrobacterales bacterium]